MARAMTARSSPRERGPLAQGPEAGQAGRFIPARAGNARCIKVEHAVSPVHPRTGGERLYSYGSHFLVGGSSPHGRGTPGGRRRRRLSGRFIPARAGNAADVVCHSGSLPVHPRTGGERALRPLSTIAHAGSSPHGRGTLPLSERQGPDRRFIPARAGNATAGRS